MTLMLAVNSAITITDPYISYNNERSGILIFCFGSQVCQIKKSSKRLIDGHLGGLL